MRDPKRLSSALSSASPTQIPPAAEPLAWSNSWAPLKFWSLFCLSLGEPSNLTRSFWTSKNAKQFFGAVLYSTVLLKYLLLPSHKQLKQDQASFTWQSCWLQPSKDMVHKTRIGTFAGKNAVASFRPIYGHSVYFVKRNNPCWAIKAILMSKVCHTQLQGTKGPLKYFWMSCWKLGVCSS